MDPNANLQEQSELIAECSEYERDSTMGHPAYGEARTQLTERREDLYQWLARGGYAPDWSRHPEAAGAYKQWVRRLARVEYGF